MRAGVGPAQAACPAAVAARASSAGVKWPRRSVRSRSSSLQRAGLLEQVDHGVAVAAEAERAAGVGQRAGRSDAVGQVAFGGRAEADAGAGAAEQRARSASVRWVACTAVRVGPSTPVSASSSVGVRPCAARQASFSARCSERWTCSGRAGGRGRRTVDSAPAGTARTECSAAPIRACGAAGSRATPVRPGVHVAVAEPALHPVQRLAVHGGGQVERVQQGDPDAGLARRPRSARAPITFGSAYGRAVRRRGAGSGTRRRTVIPASAISA